MSHSYDKIIADVLAERARQEEKFPGDTIAAPHHSNDKRLRILVEEVGEVAEALDEKHANTKRELRKELIQVAACAVGWLEALEAEEACEALGGMLRPTMPATRGVVDKSAAWSVERLEKIAAGEKSSFFPDIPGDGDGEKK